MKKYINILILVAIVVLIGVKLMENKEIVENRVYQYNKEKSIKVFTQRISTNNLAIQQKFTGTFEANKEVRVHADVQGKIVRYYVEAGSKVKKGQSLVKLDDSLLKLQLQQVNIQIETLKKDLARYQILVKADAIPGIKLEKVQQGLKTAKTQKQTILTQLGKTTIKAPFSGVVTMKFQEIGAFAAPGVPLILLTDIGSLKFTIYVSEKNLDLFSLGDTQQIITDKLPNLKLQGKVTRIGSKGNMSNNFTIEFSLKNTADKKLKTKMFGKVAIPGNIKEAKAIVIPARAIVGSEIQPQVYVVKNGKAQLTNVSIGKRFDNKAIISSGLNEGDTVVISGFINLFEGANVIN